MDCSPPGSSVREIFQARILEWLPFPPPGALYDPGVKLASDVSSALQADSSPLGNKESPYKGYLEEVRQFLLRGWVKDSFPGA